VPAGYAALLGVVLFVASVVIGSGTGDASSRACVSDEASSCVELLRQYDEHGAKLLLAAIVGGLSFICFSLPLYVLFIGAQARAERVRAALVVLAFIGPVLLAIGGPVRTIALQNVGEEFAQQAPALQSGPPANNQGEEPQSAGAKDGDDKAAEPADAKASSEAPATSTTDGASTPVKSSDEGNDETPEEELAGDLYDESDSIQVAEGLGFAGAFGMLFGMVYISLWGMRVGLVTRFWGSLGMALGISLILLGPALQFALVIWFLAVGVLLLDRWPGGRPPAWDAGVAIPWTRPGDEPPEEGPGGSVEGQGREISSGGPTDVQGDPADGDNGSDPRDGGEPPPRKRKRRR
jgi:hypothetical protein